MVETQPFSHWISVLRQRPHAFAKIAGSPKHPQIGGMVRFYQTQQGVLIAAQITGLPKSNNPCPGDFFAFHIHSGTQCSGNESDPFADTLGHYNPKNCPHPFHAGDLPPLLSNNGSAFLVFLTGRFVLRDVINRTVVIHSKPDDFTSQPAGNAGEKIACGQIKMVGHPKGKRCYWNNPGR